MGPTNGQIVEHLDQMVKRLGEMLDNPLLKETLPTLRRTYPLNEDGDCMQLIVEVKFVKGQN